MSARVVIRGLVYFGFDDDGVMAYLIDKHKDKPTSDRRRTVHAHDSMIGYTGIAGNGKASRGARADIPKNTRVTLDFGYVGQIQKHPSFVSHVPHLSDLITTTPSNTVIDENMVRAEVRMHGPGHILVPELVTWPSERKKAPDPPDLAYEGPSDPVEVRFWNSSARGQLANGCVVYLTEPDLDKPLNVYTSPLGQEPVGNPTHKFKRLSRGRYGGTDPFEHEVEPNMIEVLVDNFPRQRRHPVPWSLHYQFLFEAMGYSPAPFDPTAPDIVALRNYNSDEWDHDYNAMIQSNLAYPFPYLPLQDLSAFSNATPLHDPFVRPLCPPGCC